MSGLSLLQGRDLGVFPISIATSLAIEGLANLTPDREPVLPAGITKIDCLMVNVRTIIRNIESAFRNDEVRSLSVKDLADVVTEEMSQISAAMKEIAVGPMAVGFYYCSYNSLPKLKRSVKIFPKTPGQIARQEKTNGTLAELNRRWKQEGARPVKEYDLRPLPSDFKNEKVAFLTHLPMDLVDYSSYNRCYLLESNTGRLKDETEFHTKLQKKVPGVNLPFNMMTLQVFGDGKMFRPMNGEITDLVSGVAIKGKWTPQTTRDKISYWLGTINLKGHIADLKAMLSD